MSGRKHTVKKGECISSIAFQYGYFPDSIWNDPENQDLREKRKDPFVLFPGDIVYIREKLKKEESCATDERHTFKRKGVPEKLQLQFLVDGQPRADEAYLLELDGQAFGDGPMKTDGNGRVDVWIPPDAKRGKITFPDTGDEYRLELGNLDPIEELTGVQGRLRNLGFYAGSLDGEMTDELIQAIQEFQLENDLEPTGELDRDTLNALEKSYSD